MVGYRSKTRRIEELWWRWRQAIQAASGRCDRSAPASRSRRDNKRKCWEYRRTCPATTAVVSDTEKMMICDFLIELFPLTRLLSWFSEDGDKNACSVGYESVLEHVWSKIVWDGRSKRQSLEELLYGLLERIARRLSAVVFWICKVFKCSSLWVTLNAARPRNHTYCIHSRVVLEHCGLHS